MKVVIVALIVLLAALVAFAVPSFAQDAGGVVVMVPPTEVVFQWGDFFAILLANIADPQSVAWTAVAGALAWLITRLPAPAQWAFNLFKVDQLLLRSLQAAINSTKGATAGQTLNVAVGSEVLAKALQYAIDNGQAWLINWMGGRKGIEEKLIARMELGTGVDGAELVKAAHAIGPVKITDPVPK